MKPVFGVLAFMLLVTAVVPMSEEVQSMCAGFVAGSLPYFAAQSRWSE